MSAKISNKSMDFEAPFFYLYCIPAAKIKTKKGGFAPMQSLPVGYISG